MASVEALSCLICTNPVENNRECNACGTLFCYECIKQWTGRNPSCPQCRKSVAIKDSNDFSSFSFNRFVERTVNDLEVDCPNECSQQKVKRGNLKDHLERLCENIAKPCDMAKYGCLYSGKLPDLQKHYEGCSYYKVRHILEKYELQITDLSSKLSTVEQRNAMLGLDNEELKDKVRKLNAKLEKQLSTPPSNDTSPNSSPSSSSSGVNNNHGAQQSSQRNNGPYGSSQQQYQNNQNNSYHGQRSGNVNPNQGGYNPNYNPNAHSSNYNPNQNQHEQRRASKKNDCKQQ